jgi:small-conductance mechanosensitive channel
VPENFLKKAVPLLVMIVVGVAILTFGGHGTTTVIVGSTIEGLAGILFISLLFYEVGRSEDRARERERR